MLTNKRILVLMILVLGLALVLTGCGGDNKATSTGEKVIKIGFIGPLTGDVKTFGESTKNGFLLALEQAGNKAGDYKIEYVTADDRNDATEAVNVATKLIAEDGVKAIVGSVTSRTTIAASELANDSKMVMITGTGTAPKVTVDDNAKRKDFIFRACFIDPFQGTVAAKFATETLKAKTAAILYDQSNDYTIGLAKFFNETFTQHGGKVLSMEAYGKDDVDFSAVLTNIAQQKPDILYLPDYYQKVSLIGKQAREKGIKAIFLGGDGWDSTELDYATMEGGYFTSHYSPDDPRPEVKTWVEAYKGKYNSVPDAFATLGYDATNMLINAIKTANSDDPAKIRDALQATKDYAAVTGKLSFDKDGNPIKPAVILQIKDGKQVYVTTVNP
ncbi:Leucine-, isoleucine-, valine-, threonine-, and alanine-binding protein precursor [Pelotomaculum schinkii]|uniref:Leucine-, isoleucine-, valine-, threonine-, and alanine-binding protein n=1 Tax=Pelotomaculum schinkii TaxID=78350 RepID=A0A4Y7RIE1_9FIRM|nr:ABC transporter substrate-binding protein [Pelotomaculum schinkii]TEB08472.1 Leucine-, isoleucine-, valine-, threonine-, and alanine-binding protein precursor [Pelotomaculum schinkii]